MGDPVRFFVRPRLRDAALLLAFEGWNDAGEAATTAVRFVERAVRAVPLGEIDCEDHFDFTVARPHVRSVESGVRTIEWPHTRFSYGSLDADRELVLGWGREPHLRWRGWCDACAALVRGAGIRRVVLLGAYLADVLYSLPVGVTGFASDPALLERLGVSGSRYEGPTGIVGVLGERLRADGIDVVSLWAGLPHYISASPNPRGALALVQKLAALLGFALDTGSLERDAVHFEQRISALVAADPELGEYVRQLKKREFAQ